MNRITRATFLKQSLKSSAVLLLPPALLRAAAPHQSPNADLLQRLVGANDAQVQSLLQTSFDQRPFNRKIAYDFNLLAASYCAPTSRYYHQAALLPPLQKLAQHLLQAQSGDGTVNVGNLESPPDTAFVVEIITAGATVLQREKEAAVARITENLKAFLLRAGDALTTGGVHTPNHRWVICAALARIHALYPNPKYVRRIEDWLAEGIYINSDGNYPERSRIYSMVENTAFLSMGRLLKKPSLLEPVRKNLHATYYYMELNGELATNDSRRQDQYTTKSPDPNTAPHILSYYLLYRHMAIHDNNGFFAAITQAIESMGGFEKTVLNRSLIYFLEEPMLQKNLPAPTPLPVRFEKLFAQSHLLRIRNEATTATLFGGADQPIIIASGRSNSPDFFAYRKGSAILKYLRLSTSFFSTGYFYSEGLKKAGNNYKLHKTLTVPYYQPLPPQHRRKDGDYLLSESTDARFWNKMDFKHRPQSNVKQLSITVSLQETAGRCSLQFEVTGMAEVGVTLELCFGEGGTLSGVTAAENGTGFLEKGEGTYAFGKDVILFGPGKATHRNIANLEGERYSTHFGNLRTEGMHVYITGTTPFTHQLYFY